MKSRSWSRWLQPHVCISQSWQPIVLIRILIKLNMIIDYSDFKMFYFASYFYHNRFNWIKTWTIYLTISFVDPLSRQDRQAYLHSSAMWRYSVLQSNLRAFLLNAMQIWQQTTWSRFYWLNFSNNNKIQITNEIELNWMGSKAIHVCGALVMANKRMNSHIIREHMMNLACYPMAPGCIACYVSLSFKFIPCASKLRWMNARSHEYSR